MKNILISLFLSFLFLVSSLNANETSKSQIEQDIKYLSSLSAKSVYNIENEELPIILKPFLEKNKNIKAVIIIESTDNETFMTYFRDENKLIFNKNIPTSLTKLEKKKTPIKYDGEVIGKIVVYYKYQNKLELSNQVKTWLNKHPNIKIAVMDYWPQDKYHESFHTDIIKLINKYAGLNITTIKFNKWNDGYQKAIKGTYIHGIMNLSYSKEREEKYFYYSSPYHFTPAYLVTKKTDFNIDSLKSLKNKTIFIEKNSILIKMMEENSPLTQIKLLPDVHSMYQQLSTNQNVDGFLSYFINDKQLQTYNLKIANKIHNKYGEVHIGISHNYPKLKSIINKALKLIPKEELSKLNNKIYKTSDQIKINLTQKEKSFIEKNLPIKYVYDIDWEPFEWANDLGKHTGIVSDLLKIIKLNSGLNLQEVSSKSWNDATNKVKSKKVNMFSAVGMTDERKKYLNFTSNNLLSVPYVFVSRKKENYSNGFKSIKDKKIAVNKGYAIEGLMAKHYSDVNLVLLEDSDNNGFDKLREGDIDIYVVNAAKASLHINKLGYSDLQVAYTINLTLDLKIALHKGTPNEIISILDKSLAMIDNNIIDKLLYKYTNSSDIFTNKEKQYLKNKQYINICTNPNWAPIEFKEDGKDKGISLDILDTVKNQLGLDYKFIKTSSWKESQLFLKTKKCDILPSAIKTPKREMYANFTKPYLKYDLVIIAHKDAPEVSNLEDIIDKKMSRKQASGLINKLKKQYPKIDITESKSTLETFNLVEDGDVGFTISTLPVFLYHKNKYNLTNIKLAGYTPMKYNLSIAVRKDDRLLLNILNKALQEIPETTNKLVHEKWAAPKTINKIDWDLMFKIFGLFIFFLAGTIFWARKLAAAKKIAELATIEAQKAKKEADIAKKEVEVMHKHTRESIEYASLIQGALLPDEKLMANYFKDYFVHWMPKDTVGGDIWLLNELRNEDECLLFFIDCTGHGVPGAFVTMIVKAVEREIITKIKDDPTMEISPAWVMSYFNQTMKVLLKQETKDSKSNAGWDGGVIYYNKKTQILKFAGAETPLFYVNADGTFNTVKGNRYSVGYKKCAMDYTYKETIMEVHQGQKFYCTTDGYLDQNGGEKDFPFSKKRFGNIIKDIHTKPMSEQKDIFIDEMDKYESMVENNDRNDDMTVIVFEI